MSAWDDEDFDPTPVKQDPVDYSPKWDEDEDQDNLKNEKSNWEDEEVPVRQEKVKEKKAPQPTPQNVKQKDPKKDLKKELDAVLSDPDAERRRRKQLEEEADIANAKEAFGGNKKPIIQEIKFTDFVPSSLQDFEKFFRCSFG